MVVNDLSLSKDKRGGAMQRRYGIELVDLYKSCDGCSAKFTIKHALACKKGGLVVGHRSELKKNIGGGIAIQALVSNRARDNPKISTGM